MFEVIMPLRETWDPPFFSKTNGSSSWKCFSKFGRKKYLFFWPKYRSGALSVKNIPKKHFFG